MAYMFQLPHVFNYTVVYCEYSKTCLKWPLSKIPKIGFDYRLMYAGQKYCRMLQKEHFKILWTCIKLPHGFQTFFLFFIGRLRQVLALLYITWANPGDLMAKYKSLSFLLTIHFHYSYNDCTY